MNSISTSFPTSVPDIYAMKDALPLAERFLSCPAAATLLASDRFIKPILIDTQNIPGARIRTDWNNDDTNSILTKILIPEKWLQTTKGLKYLSFEIFNTPQGRTTSKEEDLYQQASLGNIGIDSYARQIEELEAADTLEHFELIKQCANYWKMSPKELEEYTRAENQHPEMSLFIQEVWCHTDFYRQKWVENFQKIYCEKHPDEKRSCKTKMTDLCNHDTVLNMPASERLEFIRDRTCKLLPQAHDTVKNDPHIRKAIQAKCPEVLEKSNEPIHEEL